MEVVLTAKLSGGAPASGRRSPAACPCSCSHPHLLVLCSLLFDPAIPTGTLSRKLTVLIVFSQLPSLINCRSVGRSSRGDAGLGQLKEFSPLPCASPAAGKEGKNRRRKGKINFSVRLHTYLYTYVQTCAYEDAFTCI